MNMRNCKKCGKIFTFIRSPLCKECEEVEEMSFEKVRLFLKENPNKNVEEVSEETGVSVKKILKYIKEGRIITTSGMATDVKCEKCGKAVTKGKYCSICSQKMEQEVNKMFGKNFGNNTEDNKKRTSTMYTQQKNNRK